MQQQRWQPQIWGGCETAGYTRQPLVLGGECHCVTCTVGPSCLHTKRASSRQSAKQQHNKESKHHPCMQHAHPATRFLASARSFTVRECLQQDAEPTQVAILWGCAIHTDSAGNCETLQRPAAATLSYNFFQFMPSASHAVVGCTMLYNILTK